MFAKKYVRTEELYVFLFSYNGDPITFLNSGQFLQAVLDNAQ